MTYRASLSLARSCSQGAFISHDRQKPDLQDATWAFINHFIYT